MCSSFYIVDLLYTFPRRTVYVSTLRGNGEPCALFCSSAADDPSRSSSRHVKGAVFAC